MLPIQSTAMVCPAWVMIGPCTVMSTVSWTGRAAADRDRVVHLAHPPPGAVPEVLPRAALAGLLGVEQRGLVLRVGQRPGDVLVVPDQHAGQAGHADPADRAGRGRTARPGTRPTAGSAAGAGRRPAWRRGRPPAGRWPPRRCCPGRACTWPAGSAATWASSAAAAAASACGMRGGTAPAASRGRVGAACGRVSAAWWDRGRGCGTGRGRRGAAGSAAGSGTRPWSGPCRGSGPAARSPAAWW